MGGRDPKPPSRVRRVTDIAKSSIAKVEGKVKGRAKTETSPAASIKWLSYEESQDRMGSSRSLSVASRLGGQSEESSVQGGEEGDSQAAVSPEAGEKRQTKAAAMPAKDGAKDHAQASPPSPRSEAVSQASSPPAAGAAAPARGPSDGGGGAAVKTRWQKSLGASVKKLDAVDAIKSKGDASRTKRMSGMGGAVQEDLFLACSNSMQSQTDAEYCVRMLSVNRELAKAHGSTGELPLHALCSARSHTQYSVEICRALLKAHGDACKVRWKGPDGNLSLPLHLLCKQALPTEFSAEICHLLLLGYEETTSVPSGGQLPINLVVETHAKLTEHHVTIFRRLVDANKDCVKQKGEDGRTLLHRICLSTPKRRHSENTTECTRLIFEAYRRLVDAEDNQSCKPLHALCMSPHPNEHTVNIGDLLMQNSPDAIQHKDNEGMLAVHYAFKNETLTESSVSLVRKLFEAHPKSSSIADQQGRTCLHFLCASTKLNKCTIDLARQLLLANKAAYETTDKCGRTPLHVLCSSMSEHRKGMEVAEEIFDMLLETDHEALTSTENSGKMPLHLLCEAGFFSTYSVHILEKILHAAEETIMSTDIDGRLPLHLLCESKLHTQLTCDAYRRLVRGRADDRRESNPAAIKMHDGSLPLHNLCSSGHHSMYSLEMFRALVQAYPASVSAFDSCGSNPIHRLCGASGHTDHTEEIFNDLLGALEKIGKHGAELRTLQGWLPLHIICGAGNHTSNTYRIFGRLLKLNEECCLVPSSKEKQVSRAK